MNKKSASLILNFICLFFLFSTFEAYADHKFGVFMVKKTQLDTLLKSFVAGENLDTHPYTSTVSGYSKQGSCFNSIEDAIESETHACIRSDKCDDKYFVILPCHSEYDMGEVGDWTNLKRILEKHYTFYQTNDPIGSTDTLVRFKVFEWATKIWSLRSNLVNNKQKAEKISQIKKSLEIKLNASTEQISLNDKLTKADLLKKAIRKYQSDSAPLKNEIAEFMKKFRSFERSFQTYQEKFNEMHKFAAETQKTDADSIAEVLLLQDKIENLELENRTSSLNIENSSDDLLSKLDFSVKQFKNEITPYRSVFPNQEILDNWESSLFDTLKGIKTYIIRRIAKIHEKSIKLNEFIHERALILSKKAGEEMFLEETKDTKDLQSSAEFIEKVGQVSSFLFKKYENSGLLELPILTQRYRDFNKLLEFAKICDSASHPGKSWMKSGCIHLSIQVKKVHKHLASLPQEIKGYLMIAKAVLKKPAFDTVAKAIESLLDQNKITEAIELFDSLLLAHVSDQ